MRAVCDNNGRAFEGRDCEDAEVAVVLVGVQDLLGARDQLAALGKVSTPTGNCSPKTTPGVGTCHIGGQVKLQG